MIIQSGSKLCQLDQTLYISANFHLKLLEYPLILEKCDRDLVDGS